jgi:glycerate-2-kinase
MNERNKIHLKYVIEKIISKIIPEVSLNKIIKMHLIRKGNTLTIKNLSGKKIKLNVRPYDEIIILGAGKASHNFGNAFQELFPDKKISGLIVSKEKVENERNGIKFVKAGHPLPDYRGIKATKQIISILKKSDRNKLIFFLLSGGASSLLPLPVDGFSLEEKIRITKRLINRGADINEVNSFREYFSQIKGGGLLQFINTNFVSLIISDVIGNPISSIGSAPTLFSKPTNIEVKKILMRYKLYNDLSLAAKRKLKKNIWKEFKPESKAENIILFDNKSFQNLVAIAALKNKIHVHFIDDLICGDVKIAAKKLIKKYKFIINESKNEKGIHLVLSGGETTVNVKGEGKGGRNHELSLLMLNFISRLNKAAFLSLASDGDDGNSQNAGASIDSGSKHLIKKLNLNPKEFLDSNDSFSLFKQTGELFHFPKGITNVMDIQFFLFVID